MPGTVARDASLEPSGASRVTHANLVVPMRSYDEKAGNRLDQDLVPVFSADPITHIDREPAPSSQLTPPERPEDAAPRLRDLARADHTEEVQQKLAGLGFFSGPIVGVWGPRSRDALRAFKEAHDLGADDHWDEQTESVLFDPTMKHQEISSGSGQRTPLRALRTLVGGVSFLL